MVWVCSYGVPECPICKRHREEREAAEVARKREELAKKIMARVTAGLTNGSIKAVMKNGKVRLLGLALDEANEECVLRAIMLKGPALARAQIAKAEQSGGVAKRVIGQR